MSELNSNLQSYYIKLDLSIKEVLMKTTFQKLKNYKFRYSYLFAIIIMIIIVYSLIAPKKQLDDKTNNKTDRLTKTNDLGTTTPKIEQTTTKKFTIKSNKISEKSNTDYKKFSNPEIKSEFFSRLHYPYPAELPMEVMHTMWDEINQLPTELEMEGTYSSPWECIGPFGVTANYLDSSANNRFTGRVLDLEAVDGVGLRFAAASGGLWSTASIVHFPISDSITSLAISTFDTKPGDPYTIIVGTGEAGAGRVGTGLWRTTDGGASWQRQLYFERYINRVRYDPVVPNLVHALGEFGYYRSTNNGESWDLRLGGFVTDIAFGSNQQSRVIYISKYNDGIFRSTDDGYTWEKVTGTQLPENGNGQTVMTSMFLPSSQKSVFYVSMHRTDKDSLLGIYKSTDAGFTWSKTIGSPNGNVGSYGIYSGAIAVCPTNPNIVVVGWIKSYITADGGRTWYLIDNLNPLNHDNTHDDWHKFLWLDNGFVYGANDGGIYYSTDYGVTWQHAANNSPITQFYTVAVGGPDNKIIFGGTQDNGIIRSTDGGQTWLNVKCCDGAGVAILPTLPPPINSTPVVTLMGSFPWQGEREITFDYGNSWAYINQNLGLGGIVRSDSEGTIYTPSGSTLYRSSNWGNTWEPVNETPFPKAIINVTIGAKDQFLGRTIYAPIDTNQGDRLYVCINGIWVERSANLPSDIKILKVIPHPTFPSEAYAVMQGLSSGKKIYYTPDRGATWINITNGFPNIPISDLVVHPSYRDFIIVGTEMGCYKTMDFGQHWYPWNYGMPKSNIITEMTLMDNSATTGEISVVAASYGRSIWKRNFMVNDPGVTKVIRKIRKPILDNTTILDTINFAVPSGSSCIRAVVRLDSLLHQRDRDLTIVLIHNGIRDTLVYRNGAEGYNFIGTEFSDEAAMSVIEGQPPFTGPFKPLRPLNQFNGTEVTGEWLLEINDDSPGATGMLIGWTLTVDYEATTNVKENTLNLFDFKLYQNYPNPFNPITRISWQSPVGCRQTLKIYDILGKEVATLVDEFRESGKYEITFDASKLSSGIYLYQLQAGSYIETKKMMLLK